MGGKVLQNVALINSYSHQRLLGWIDLQLFVVLFIALSSESRMPCDHYPGHPPITRNSETHHLSICFHNDTVRQRFST